MSFPRAFTIALMAELLLRGNGGLLESFAVMGLGAILWFIAPDPLPAAIERGLDAYRRKHQR